MSKQSVPRTCWNCKIELVDCKTRRRFCSRKCANKYWRSPDESGKRRFSYGVRECESCGKVFEVYNPRLRFCSVECSRPVITKERIDRCAEKLTCPECGGEFVKRWQAHRYCSRECSQKWNRKHREMSDDGTWGWLKKYGLDRRGYDLLLQAQGGRCAICQAHQYEKDRRLGVDHDHDTGEIRGILCTQCNSAIGLLGDDVDLLRRAIEYLIFGPEHRRD